LRIGALPQEQCGLNAGLSIGGGGGNLFQKLDLIEKTRKKSLLSLYKIHTSENWMQFGSLLGQDYDDDDDDDDLDDDGGCGGGGLIG
jgi:hypothetical protein